MGGWGAGSVGGVPRSWPWGPLLAGGTGGGEPGAGSVVGASLVKPSVARAELLAGWGDPPAGEGSSW